MRGGGGGGQNLCYLDQYSLEMPPNLKVIGVGTWH